MTETKSIKYIISNISKEEWEPLFDLIPIIENTKKFGEMIVGDKMSEQIHILPYMIPSACVLRFSEISYDLKIVHNFDWMNWQEGKELVEKDNADYSKLDTETLCKLITRIIRGDRFCEGYMVGCFERGIVLKILNALKEKSNGKY